MLKIVLHLFTLALFAALVAATPSRTLAAEQLALPTEGIEQEKKSSRVPFRGKIWSIDKEAMTMTLEGKEKKRVIQVTAQTKIMKAGQPATLADAVPGEEVGGLVVRKDNGKEEAVSIRLGEKLDRATKPKPVTRSR